MKIAVDPWHLDATSTAKIKAEGERLRAETAAKRAARAGLAISGEPIDRRVGSERRTSERRTTVDRRGALTVEVDNQVVIRPRKDLKRFDARPADVSAFMLDDQMRGRE